MGLTSILQSLEASIAGEVAGTTFDYGRRYVARNAEPPRVVWARGRDAYAPARRSGGNPRSLATREAALEAYLWGRTEEDVEALSEAIYRALHHSVLGPSFEASALDWGASEYLERGASAVMFLSVHIPVTDTPAPVVVVNEFQPDSSGPSTVGDGALDRPEVT